MDLYEEAGKENKQTLTNFGPAEECTRNDEVEIEKFLPGRSVWDNLDLPLG